jgi:ribosomal protein S18 acetylase RimI-like enzyme
MVPGYDIRAFAPSDLAALQQIRATAFAPVFASFRDRVGAPIAEFAFASAEQEQAELLAEICTPGGRHHLLVVVQGGVPVGFCAWTADEARRTGEIGLNCVHPDHAGRGIGTAMYAHVLAVMKARGIEVVEVSTGADPSHAAARRAYQKAGFGPSIPSVTFYRRL